MASLIETLIDVLDKENTEYQGLLKLSEEKTTAIVNGNVERLQEILGLEQRRLINLMLSGMRMWEIYAMSLIFLEKE